MKTARSDLLPVLRATENLANLWHSHAEQEKGDENQSPYAVYLAVKKALSYEAEANRLRNLINAS